MFSLLFMLDVCTARHDLFIKFVGGIARTSVMGPITVFCGMRGQRVGKLVIGCSPNDS